MIKLKKIINNISRNNNNFTFVSIGANDGIFVDEVFQSNLLNPNWTCYFIEPVKETFDKLIKNYAKHYPNNKFIYENYAIHIENGTDYLITYKEDDSRGMCSFFRAENEHTEKIKVEKIKLETFISKYNINNIDFLKTDCEGMDYEIILQCLDLGIAPSVILFEDISLDVNNTLIRSMFELIEVIEKRDDYAIIDDIFEYKYEESNKLIIKKELLKYV